MYKKGTGNDKQGKDMGNRRLCLYRNFSQAIIVGNTASKLTAQSALLSNFENVINCRVNIQEDIECYQDTLSNASSKVDYSMGENIYMLPSDMNLKIKTTTVRYNNKILVSDGKFSLGKNDKVNSLVLGPMGPTCREPVIPMTKGHPCHEVIEQQTQAHELSQKPTHEEEKIAFVLFLAGGFVI